MATALPLHLRVVRQDWTDRVPSPAHDSLTSAARREYLEAHPDSYLGVTRGPEDYPEGREVTIDELLTAGRSSLERLIETGAFTELRPAMFYLYQLELDGHVQTAVVGGVAISDFTDGGVKLHEHVRPERAHHLGRHFGIVGVQSSPIALAHRPNEAMAEIRRGVMAATDPILDFTTDDGLTQRVWPVEDPETCEQITDIVARLDLYLIDGHHRTAAALAHREAVGPGRPDRALSAIFSSDELQNIAHHRMLRLGSAADRFVSELSSHLDVRTTADMTEVEQRRADELALYTNGVWHLVSVPLIDDKENRLDNLDPVRLQRALLSELLGLDGVRYDDIVEYRPGTETWVDLMAEADAEGRIFCPMRPVAIDDLLSAADAGLIMPPKSTYFEPKARSGVFVRPVVG